jgi:hypothetical protein
VARAETSQWNPTGSALNLTDFSAWTSTLLLLQSADSAMVLSIISLSPMLKSYNTFATDTSDRIRPYIYAILGFYVRQQMRMHAHPLNLES